MFKNFQLVTITNTHGRMGLYNIPLHRDLQDKLAENWWMQYEAFVNDIHETDFDAGYNPEEHERFRLEGYELPYWLSSESSLTVPALDSIKDHENIIDSIKGVAAFVRDSKDEEIILFQNFSRSHVIRPGRFLFLNNDTYETAQRPGLTLDGKLSAVYQSAHGKLLFHNFRTTNTFLPLADYYEEASEHEIQDILNHKLLSPEDAKALSTEANQWFRKRFAMLKDSGILDKYTAAQIKQHSNGYEVDIKLDGAKIVFPSDKANAKRLLQFLNEELFRGAITDRLYETNSKRETD